MGAPYYIGVDLGGTKILAGLFDADFKILARAKQATNPESGGQAVFARIVQSVDSIISESSVDPAKIAALGLAVPGQIVPDARIVRYAPNLGWRDFDLSQLIPASWK